MFHSNVLQPKFEPGMGGDTLKKTLACKYGAVLKKIGLVLQLRSIFTLITHGKAFIAPLCQSLLHYII